MVESTGTPETGFILRNYLYLCGNTGICRKGPSMTAPILIVVTHQGAPCYWTPGMKQFTDLITVSDIAFEMGFGVRTKGENLRNYK